MPKITPALIIAINEALEKEREKTIHRKFAVHPYGKKRTEKCQFNIINEDLRRFPEKFQILVKGGTRKFQCTFYTNFFRYHLLNFSTIVTLLQNCS
jgi:hypothetical protein